MKTSERMYVEIVDKCSERLLQAKLLSDGFEKGMDTESYAENFPRTAPIAPQPLINAPAK